MNSRSQSSNNPTSSPRIVVAGAAHIDRSGWLSAPSALGCSNPGKFDERPGGTALNIARNLAALQSNVELISLVGRDAAGTWLGKEIKTYGIIPHVSGPDEVDAHTGTYTSIIEPDGSLLVAVADMAIYEHFSSEAVENVVSQLTQADWICADTNLPPAQVSQLLNASAARKAGVTVSTAKAPRMREFAHQLDLVFTNVSEAHALCGFDIADNKPLFEIASALGDLGISKAVISYGDQPVAVLEAGTIEKLEVASIDKVADVTGAGDALVGASLFALTQGRELAEAVTYGIKAARATIQIRGAVCNDLAQQVGSP